MFTRHPREKTGVEKAIDQLLIAMSVEEEGSTKYAEMVDQLVKLHALQVNETKPRVSADTLASIAANLGGILIIVGHERAHIVTSKALGFIRRLG